MAAARLPRPAATLVTSASALLVVVLLVLALAQPSEAAPAGGSRVRARINAVVDKEKHRLVEEALDAEFELADADEDGALTRAEFGTYLVKEDHFSPLSTGAANVDKGEGQWLGSKGEAARAAGGGLRGGDAGADAGAGAGAEGAFGVAGGASASAGPEGAEGAGGSAPPREVVGTFFEGTARSFAMIVVSELGDETFIVAALMAMRHPRAVILAGALGALYFMTVISAAMGFVMPKLISPEVTHRLATFMYLFFGCRLAWIGYHSEGEGIEEEMDEAEKNLKGEKKPQDQFQQFMAKICTPVLVEAFVLTFLAEWGDRSQIATITLAAHQNLYGVILGACAGHSLCTALAVFGGKLLATQISQKTVAFAGSATFFLFAMLNLLRG
jgi:putative Ca2+/H+ antiporter (TMEM165/GDT1 family)